MKKYKVLRILCKFLGAYLLFGAIGVVEVHKSMIKENPATTWTDAISNCSVGLVDVPVGIIAVVFIVWAISDMMDF